MRSLSSLVVMMRNNKLSISFSLQLNGTPKYNKTRISYIHIHNDIKCSQWTYFRFFMITLISLNWIFIRTALFISLSVNCFVSDCCSSELYKDDENHLITACQLVHFFLISSRLNGFVRTQFHQNKLLYYVHRAFLELIFR